MGEIVSFITRLYKPNEEAIKLVLMQVLEQHYGSLDGAVKMLDAEKKCLCESVLEKYGFR